MGGLGSGRGKAGSSWRQSSKEARFKKGLRMMVKYTTMTQKEVDSFSPEHREYINYYLKKYKKQLGD